MSWETLRVPGAELTGAAGPAVRELVVEWFRALDRHDDLDTLLGFLVADGFEMRLPLETRHGHDGFRDWYTVVTHRYFDEKHRVTGVDVERDDHVTTLEVSVNWQARVWRPPAAHSEWMGFDARQTWYLVPGDDGRLLVRTYVVTALEPMPGSSGI